MSTVNVYKQITVHVSFQVY